MTLCARDIMKTDVHTVEPAMTLVDFERFLLEKGIGGSPVVEGGKVLGMCTRVDIIRKLSLEQNMAEVASGAYAHDPGGAGERQSLIDAIGSEVGDRIQKLSVRDAMTQMRAVATPDTPIQEVARLMLDRHTTRVPVMDGDRLVGMLARRDVVGLVATGKVKEA